jgi:serine/threonine protein kinase
VIGLGEESSGLRYAVMELVPGGSASDRLRSGRPFAPLEALRIAFESASALVVAHEAGVIHRDIKPGNILLGNDDRAQLSDFGIARLLDPNTTAVTEPGDRLGTIGFEAPELRVDATQATPASDIYALGATLYALVVGRAPPDLALLHLNAAPLRGLPEPIAEVITRATRMQADARYPSAEAFARATAEAHDQLAAAEGAPLRAEAWMRSLEHHRKGEGPARPPAGLIWAALALVVALVAVGVALRY